MSVDTDVNGAALAEGRWGAARGLRDYAYVTVGTGVGVGSIVGGQPVLGLTHTEAGHIRIARRANDHWPGSCPFHGDCVEGLASGTAIQARAGKSAELLATDDQAWDFAAHALGQLLHTLVLCTAPCRILMGGGVMIMQPHLLPRIRNELKLSLGGYLHSSEVDTGLNEYIVPPQLGGNAGPLGALVLADQALHTAAM
jgi:fructokinase